MWAPGTLVYIYGIHTWAVLGRTPHDNEKRPKAIAALVIATRETGFGTKGHKWDSLILTHGVVIEVNDVWKKLHMFRTCE